jgi:hypothetical protein
VMTNVTVTYLTPTPEQMLLWFNVLA